MKNKVRDFVPIGLAVLLCVTASNAEAATTYTAQVHRAHKPYVQHHDVTLHEYFAAHPKVRAATIGAGVGTAAGAVTGMVTGRGTLRGALIGGGTGIGVGLVRSSSTMRRHPVVKNVATGTLIGWALGMAGGANRGTPLRTAAVGGAAGLATQLLVHGI